MKKNIILLFGITCFNLLLLVSCESHEKKADDAFDRVKEEKEIVNDNTIVHKEIVAKKDTMIIRKEAIQTSKKKLIAMKTEVTYEWTDFKIEAEKKIFANENTIKEIKGTPSANLKLLRKITEIEKDNNDLRRQMDEYKEEMKVQWEKFKMKINHDVNEISIELKDISVNTKK